VKRLAIVGASGHGSVVADAALLSGWSEVLFFDDAWPGKAALHQWAVVGTFGDLALRVGEFEGVIVAIGDNATRLARVDAIERAGLPLVTVVHPSAALSPLAKVGDGSIVAAGAVVNPFARLGRGCIVNTGASIDHDCVLGDGVHVSPGAHLGGGVRVGAGSWIGIGAAVKHGVTIGDRAIVGAGAVVIRDVEADVTVVGVPAGVTRC
jgi:sugar O-acyltransferase (sialic acid O-acetyltransferase NeuD family)